MASAAKRRKAARKKKELENQTTSSPHGTGDLISENDKDSDGSTVDNSPTSEDHPNSFNEGNEDLKSGELPSPQSASMNKPPESNAVVQIVKKVEAGVDLQIEWKDAEETVGDETVGDETDGQGSELKSNGILIVKAVKKEETEEELESTSIYIKRLESAKESYNGESESLPVVNSAENPPEVPMTRLSQRSSWMNCCGLLDVISGSRT